jgi:hypothetical protein
MALHIGAGSFQREASDFTSVYIERAGVDESVKVLLQQ